MFQLQETESKQPTINQNNKKTQEKMAPSSLEQLTVNAT